MLGGIEVHIDRYIGHRYDIYVKRLTERGTGVHIDRYIGHRYDI